LALSFGVLLFLGVLWAIFGIWSDFYGEDPKRPAAFCPDKKTMEEAEREHKVR
jgi:hypothetical protein